MKQDEFESLSIFEQATITPAYQQGFQAGAASRDAEIAEMVAALKSMMNDSGLVLLMRPDQIERNNHALAKVRKPT